MNHLSYLTFMLTVAALSSGCATSDDPRKGGLLGGVHGISAGTYDKRLEEREANLEAVRRAGQSAEAEQVELQGERVTLKTERDHLTAQVTDIERDRIRLQSRVDALRVSAGEAESRRMKLSQRLNRIQSDIRALKNSRSDTASAATVKDYQARVAELEAEMVQLWEIYNALQ